MLTKISICKVHDSILGTSELEVIFNRNGKLFHGPLFWKHADEKATGARITRYLETVEINEEDSTKNDLMTYDAAIELSNKHGIKVYDDTLKTMMHWSFVNGFTDNYNKIGCVR